MILSFHFPSISCDIDGRENSMKKKEKNEAAPLRDLYTGGHVTRTSTSGAVYADSEPEHRINKGSNNKLHSKYIHSPVSLFPCFPSCSLFLFPCFPVSLLPCFFVSLFPFPSPFPCFPSLFPCFPFLFPCFPISLFPYFPISISPFP
jgi:hypothetical protein